MPTATPLKPAPFRLALAILLAAACCTANAAAVLGAPRQFSAKACTAYGGGAAPGLTICESVQLNGGTLLYREGEGRSKKTARFKPTPEQWAEFRRTLDGIDVWHWQASYSSGTVADGAPAPWSLDIKYADRSLHAKGAYLWREEGGPLSVDYIGGCRLTTRRPYGRYLAAVKKLVGGRPFGDRRYPLENYDLDELQLVSTHPSPKLEFQWADFRDPTGNVYRVQIKGIYNCCDAPPDYLTVVGPTFAVLHEVSRSSVTLREECQIENGQTVTRETVVKMVDKP